MFRHYYRHHLWQDLLPLLFWPPAERLRMQPSLPR